MPKGLEPSPSIGDDDLLATPERLAADRRRWWRATLGSGLFHALMLALLLGLWRSEGPVEAPPIPVVLIPGIGEAGAASGGDGGGAMEQGPTAKGAETEPQESADSEGGASATPTAESAPQADLPQPAEPAQPMVTAAEAPTPPAADPSPATITPPPGPDGQTQASTAPPDPHPEHAPPVPPHKPSPPQPAPVDIATAPPSPHPAPAAVPAVPTQTATAPNPAATPGVPGFDEGSGGPGGVGQGVEGTGLGVVGQGKGPGDDYLDRVRRHIRRYLTYPEVARKQKREGDATMAVVLRRDGTVLSAKIEQSTGYAELDNAMLRAVHDASPVPPFPKTYPREQGEVLLPFDFHLGFLDRIFR